MLYIHCNGLVQIFIKNLEQYQRYCVETAYFMLFQLTITIIDNFDTFFRFMTTEKLNFLNFAIVYFSNI